MGKLTAVQFDILKLCATTDESGQQGIASRFHRRFTPKSSKALARLIRLGYVIFSASGYAVTTDAGLARYYAETADLEWPWQD